MRASLLASMCADYPEQFAAADPRVIVLGCIVCQEIDALGSTDVSVVRVASTSERCRC